MHSRRRRVSIRHPAARFHLKIGPSRIHRLGVFAAEAIPGLRYVMEYTGRRIHVRDEKKELAKAGRPKRIVTVRLNREWILDALYGGSGAEYINHSCEPNLFSRNTGKRIFLVARRPIVKGEELTIDYRMVPKTPRLSCRCGARRCRGYMNMP